MKKYKVHVMLEETYTVDAENEQEAFEQASDLAIIGGTLGSEVEEVKED